MAAKSEKRVFAGYYTRYDGKRIYVVRVVHDFDTGSEIVICQDASSCCTRSGGWKNQALSVF